MKYNEYRFLLTEMANPYNSHAIITELLGKETKTPYSSLTCGQFLLIKTKQILDVKNGKIKVKHGQRVVIATLDDFSIKEVSNKESTFTIKAVFSYGVKKDNKKTCPVSGLNINKDELTRMLSKNGLKLEKINYAKNRESILGKKVEIHNIFELSAQVSVLDSKLWEEKQISGFGQRRSYGFGGFEII
jgi:hypothetical protein